MAAVFDTSLGKLRSAKTAATAIATIIVGLSAKTTLVDADSMAILDSANSNALKKVTWANIKATLKTYFDTLYSGKIASLLEDLTPQLGGDLDVNGKKIASVSDGDITIEPNGTGQIIAAKNAYVKTLSEMLVAHGNTSGAKTLDLSAASIHSATSTDAIVWTFSNPAATGRSTTFTLILTNGGAYAQTWPASVKWLAGVAPALTASGRDRLMFTTIDGGTTWDGVLVGENFS